MDSMYYHPPRVDIKENVKEIFTILKKEKLIGSQDDFSTDILNRSKHYFSSILAKEENNFSVDSLSWLVSQLDFMKREYNTPIINQLYNSAIKCLDKRLKETVIPCHHIQVVLPLKQ